MTDISDILKDAPQVPWHGNDNTMKTCPDCSERGINYCPMCRRPLSKWAIYRIYEKEAIKVMNLNGREYPLSADDVTAITMILMSMGFTNDKKEVEKYQKLPLRWTKKQFNQVYYNVSGLRRVIMDIAVDMGDIIIEKDPIIQKPEQPIKAINVKRRGRPVQK